MKSFAFYVVCLAVLGCSFTSRVSGACSTIVDVAMAANYTSLVTALDAADLLEALDSDTVWYTVFAPSDEAIATALTTLGIGAAEFLDSGELLESVLKAHVANSAQRDLNIGQGLTGLDGKTQLSIQKCESSPIGKCVLSPGNSVAIVGKAIKACNSYVYPIDGVLLPGKLNMKNGELLIAG